MTDQKKPVNYDIFKSKEDCNDQQSSGLSCAVIQIEKYLERIKNNQGRLRPNDDVIEDALKSIQAAYIAEGGPRVIKANYLSVTGWVSGTQDHDPVPFESSLERDCAYIAMFEPRISRVSAQPYTIIYQDSTGRSRRYTPDFEFSYPDENNFLRKAIIEVKPYDILQKNRVKYQERFHAMEQLAESKGNAFYVLTERQIRTPRLLNTKALFSRVYDYEVNSKTMSSFYDKLYPHLPCKFGFAAELLGQDLESQGVAQGHIWALLSGHELTAELGQPITFDSILSDRKKISKRDLFFEPGEVWEIDD